MRHVDGTQPGGVAATTMLALAVGIAFVGCLVAARGLWIMSARTAEGAILVVGGSTAAGLAWYWLLIQQSRGPCASPERASGGNGALSASAAQVDGRTRER